MEEKVIQDGLQTSELRRQDVLESEHFSNNGHLLP